MPSLSTRPTRRGTRIRPGTRSSRGISTPEPSDVEPRHQGRVVARAQLAMDRGGDRFLGQRPARHQVVDPPADVALAEVPPRRPPGEELVVLRIERPAD